MATGRCFAGPATARVAASLRGRALATTVAGAGDCAPPADAIEAALT
ncbi:hypothetical protein BZL30_1772 [Mycobacterium kansasii]|uniref:Uncharacterized protein n=1 Tax=Mycobacterium kansasii TaxID=1768 RepID=A0A1V3XIE9_MYCKA|nr:hypothetical protein BZL30_1772 [Mycobacterium kansasii]